jgi:hypothetical protein
MKIKILFDTGFELSISLLETDFVRRWCALLEQEIANNTLMQDDTYSALMSEQQSKWHLEQAIQTVNKFLKVEFIKIPTQQDYDNENYFNDLHKKFEQLSGPDWDHPTKLMILAPDHVKLAIKHINRFCHRLERRPYTMDSIIRVEFNTHKRQALLPEDYDLFELVDYEHTVVLDYSTLGKSLHECFEDGLTADHQASKNQEHFCANFILRFAQPQLPFRHQEFLNWCDQQGIINLPKSAIGVIKLGKIDQTNSFEQVQKTDKIVNITLEKE